MYTNMFVNILTLFRFYIGLCTRRSFHSKMYTMTTQYISTQYLGTFKSLRNTCTYITKLLYKQVLTTTGKSCSHVLCPRWPLLFPTWQIILILLFGMCEPGVIISAVKGYNFGFNFCKGGFHGNIMKEGVLWGWPELTPDRPLSQGTKSQAQKPL